MHAYLITGIDNPNIEKKITDLIRTEKSARLEFPLKKIEDVRNLVRYISLSLDKPLIIIIRDIDEATPEALNAFLKNLEEPNRSIKFILTAKSKYQVLETIVSRCQVVNVSTKPVIFEDDIYHNFIEKNLSQKFLFIDALKTRRDAVTFIEQYIYFFFNELHKDRADIYRTSKQLKLAQEILNNLKANGNVNLNLTLFALKTHNLQGN